MSGIGSHISHHRGKRKRSNSSKSSNNYSNSSVKSNANVNSANAAAMRAARRELAKRQKLYQNANDNWFRAAESTGSRQSTVSPARTTPSVELGADERLFLELGYPGYNSNNADGPNRGRRSSNSSKSSNNYSNVSNAGSSFEPPRLTLSPTGTPRHWANMLPYVSTTGRHPMQPLRNRSLNAARAYAPRMNAVDETIQPLGVETYLARAFPNQTATVLGQGSYGVAAKVTVGPTTRPLLSALRNALSRRIELTPPSRLRTNSSVVVKIIGCRYPMRPW